MATIHNRTPWPMPLPNGLVLAAKAILTCTNSELDAPDMRRALPALLATGDVAVTRDADVPEDEGEPEIVPPRRADMPPAVAEGEPEIVPPRRAEASVEDEEGEPEEMPARVADETPAEVTEPQAVDMPPAEDAAPEAQPVEATAPDAEA